MTDGPCQGRNRTSDEHKFLQKERRRTADGNGTVRFKDEIGHRTNINPFTKEDGGRAGDGPLQGRHRTSDEYKFAQSGRRRTSDEGGRRPSREVWSDLNYDKSLNNNR